MPINPTYPGVYIEEIPSGSHPIVGVATSIGAFIDFFTQGPSDTAIHILSLGDFQRYFGGLNTNSEASYAIQQFFLNGGAEAYVVRVGDGSTIATAAVILEESSGGTQVVMVSAGTMYGGNSVNAPGAWGNNIRVEVDYNTTDPTQLFNLTVSLIDPTTGLPAQTEIFRNLTFKPGQPTYAPTVVNQASQLVQISPPPGSSFPTAGTWTSAYRPDVTGALGAALPVAPAIPALDKTTPANNTFVVTVDPDGTGASKYNQTVQLPFTATPPKDYPTFRPFLEAAIRASAASAHVPNDPLLAGASVQLMGSGNATVPYQYRVLAGRGGGVNFNANAKLSFSDANAAPHNWAHALGLDAASSEVQQYSLGTGSVGAQTTAGLPSGFGKGADGGAPGAAQIIGVQANKTGMFALENADLFNIMCLPAAANLGSTDFQTVITAATAYCDYRRAFLIVDIPSSVGDIPTMQSWMSQNDTLRDINNAVYFPRVLIPDPLNSNLLRNFGPSGTIAGLYAATDAARGVFKAPAGTEAVLRNVSQLAYKMTDGENGVLNPLGINCLRTFPVFGNVCWGARTLDGADIISSDWKYVPIRRLALFLEESLYRGTKWAVFEPNDAPLWSQLRNSVGSFMQDQFRQGAFQGNTPQQAYLVKCDSETTTPLDQANGVVNIIVGFAPLKPAEFVIIQIQQLAGQLTS